MVFETHTLTSPLSDSIESIFYFKNFQPEHAIERVVPTGHVFLIFELDGIERCTYNNESLEPLERFKNVWVSGMHSNYLSISAVKNSEMLVVQFKTLGAHPFLDHPVSDITNKVIPAEFLFGDEIISLRHTIMKAASASKKFKLIETWLTSRFSKDALPSKELITIYNSIAQASVNKHSEVVKSYSKTQKHLISQFKKYAGLTPKVLHRILRFNTLLGSIHQKDILSWAQIADEFGYADQSHFIKEFKEFSGFNPEEFIKQDYQDNEPNFFPIDKKG